MAEGKDCFCVPISCCPGAQTAYVPRMSSFGSGIWKESCHLFLKDVQSWTFFIQLKIKILLTTEVSDRWGWDTAPPLLVPERGKRRKRPLMNSHAVCFFYCSLRHHHSLSSFLTDLTGWRGNQAWSEPWGVSDEPRCTKKKGWPSASLHGVGNFWTGSLRVS